MNTTWKELLLAAFLGLVLPWILVNTVLSMERSPTAASEPAQIWETERQTVPHSAMTMTLRQEKGSTEMDMDTYLTGVLLAELPASFEMEAKKAQAVAARTFAWKAAVTGGKHGDGSVCGNASCCQAYISPEAYTARGGSEEAVEQARLAASGTSGYVLTYKGELIEATYFSCSGGSTEDAVAVWGADFPYLRAVESPGEENATHFTDTVYFTVEELNQALGVTLNGTPDTWFGFATYTAGGGVNTLRIGGKDYKGTELRTRLGLRSTAFTVTPDANGVTISTRGFGHRVGMSQYGAEAMAVSGKDYRQILAYYYAGTELEFLEGEEAS